MTNPPPNIDQRTAGDIARQTQDLIKVYTEAWPEFDPATGVSDALIGVFARFAEITIQRLNQAPQKNFLAFLDLLGATRLPPRPARVPLTFSLAAGSAVDGLVPAGTQVAAPPAEGEKEPVIFETERELTVTAAQLTALFARDPEQDKYADHSAIIEAPSATGALVFQGDRRIEHIFYIGHSQLLGFPVIENLRLSFTLTSPPRDARTLRWELWSGTGWNPILPIEDNTDNLQRPGTISFGAVNAIPTSPVNAIENRWMRCLLLTPITPSAEKREGMERASQLPLIKKLEIEVDVNRASLTGEAAFTNLLPADSSKEFFPFGEKPRFTDAFWLAHREAFSTAGAKITLPIVLVNPAGPGSEAPPPVKASANLKLKWEVWDGAEWIEMGVSTPNGPQGPIANEFADTTNALTKSGQLSFRLPAQVAATTVNGVENCWMRARIGSGDYGQEARYEPKDPNNPDAGYKFFPATFAPPVISSIKINYSLSKTAPPEAALTFSDFVYEDVTSSNNDPNREFAPFRPMEDTKPTFYLGFTLPPGRTTFLNSAITLFSRVAEFKYGERIVPLANPHIRGADFSLRQHHIPAPRRLKSAPLFFRSLPAVSPGEQLRLAWEYWNGEWVALTVRDHTDNLTSTGLIEFLAPPDGATRQEFGQPPRYWLRVRWEKGEYALAPRLRRMLLNTTMAAQTVTLRNEILGSSDGSGRQKFRATRAPVLTGPRLEVREPEMPSAAEQEAIIREEGEDAITLIRDAADRPKEIWTRWRETPDFYGSSPRSRHYVIDHLTGEIRFGDELNGLIPPAGVGNIRLARYQIGGGSAGNKSAGAIVQLKTTVPYVDRVINTEAAAGGADAETLDSLLQRAPRTIRHGGRAVTVEDYEDLAMLASPEVARARCIPLRNLIEDPLGQQPTARGEISVIIVPRSSEAKPQLSLELIARAQDYLEAHSTPTANVSVVGPLYIRVNVVVEVALVSIEGASAVEQAVRQKLAGFLHPLTGGLDGAGWDFGRKPQASDIYALIEAVPGVDHIRSLKITEDPDQLGVGATGRFLVFSGDHTINLVFAEPSYGVATPRKNENAF